MKLQEITQSLFRHLREAAGNPESKEVYFALAEADKVMLSSAMLLEGNPDALSTSQRIFDNCRNIFSI